jgi:hypothetical protein
MLPLDDLEAGDAVEHAATAQGGEGGQGDEDDQFELIDAQNVHPLS